MNEPKNNPSNDSTPKAVMYEKDLATTGTNLSANLFTTAREPYCAPGFRGLGTSDYVALCALFSALGGPIFGYNQGVVSVILVEEQFLQRFSGIAEGSASFGFWKGLLTAMIELLALIGALDQGWIADKYSRKYSIVMAVLVFIVGSSLPTAAMDYPMLVGSGLER